MTALNEDISSYLHDEGVLRQYFSTPVLNRTAVEKGIPMGDKTRLRCVQNTARIPNAVVVFGISELYEACGARVSLAELHSMLSSRADSADQPYESLDSTLRALTSHPNSKSYLDASRPAASWSSGLTKVRAALAGSSVNAEGLYESPKDVAMKLLELLGVNTLDEPFEIIDQRMQWRQSQLSVTTREEDEAEDEEKYDELERIAEERIRLLGEDLDLIEEKFGLVEAKLAEFATFDEKSRTSLIRAAVARAGQWRESFASLLDRCLADSGKVQRLQMEEESRFVFEEEKWAARCLQTEKRLHENEEEQMKCWALIDKCERDLRQLATDRLACVTEFSHEVQWTRDRRERHQQVIACIAIHLKSLDEVIQTCRQAVDAHVTFTSELLTPLSSFLNQRHALSVEITDSLKLPLHLECYTHFHQSNVTHETLARMREKELQILQKNAEDTWQLQWLTKTKREQLVNAVLNVRTSQRELVTRHLPTVAYLLEHKLKVKTAEERLSEADVTSYCNQINETMQRHENERFAVPPVDPPLGSGSVPTIPKIRADALSPRSKAQRKAMRLDNSVISINGVAAPVEPLAFVQPLGHARLPLLQSPRQRNPAREQEEPMEN